MRKKEVKVFLDDDTYGKLKEQAKKSNQSMSSILAQSFLYKIGRRIKINPDQESRFLYVELAEVESKLRGFKEGKDIDLEEIERQIKQIRAKGLGLGVVNDS